MLHGATKLAIKFDTCKRVSKKDSLKCNCQTPEAVRDGLYTERDPGACDELLTYEQRPNGSYAARSGCHDDILMTRALALHALHTAPVTPAALDPLPDRLVW